MTGIILVGGKSRRMGQDKAVMSVGGKQVFRRILDIFEPIFDEILIITNEKGRFADYGYTEVVDLIPESGPMGGIYTGLYHSKSERVFAASCDLPFIHSAPVRAIVDEAIDYDIVVPEINGRMHPLHAVYSKRCMPHIMKRIENNDRNITKFINEMSVSGTPFIPYTSKGKGELWRFSHDLKVKKIHITGLTPEDMWEQTVFNMNTPEEWQEANAIEKAKASKK